MAHLLRERFVACQQRIARSGEHLDTLAREIQDVFAACDKGEMYDIVEDSDSEPGYSIHRLRELKPFPAVRFGILVGDIVHQTRAAFDNLIELLNIREIDQPTPRTEFPVYSNEDSYLHGRADRRRLRSAAQKMGSVGTEAAEVIETLQPYHRGDDYALHPLWILHGLWIMDKHRNPSVVASVGQNTGKIKPRVRSTDGTTATVSIHEIVAPEFFPFEDGAEVCRIRLDRSANLEMEVENELTLHIAFRHDQPGGRHQVVPLLGECLLYAAQALAKFEKFF